MIGNEEAGVIAWLTKEVKIQSCVGGCDWPEKNKTQRHREAVKKLGFGRF